ncbi:helix-turn-helix domain-containing protein [Ancylobacter sonchi]|uniref:helix-turn-helix domain-containing protein n=1 Tax=Ancylobacter sonchi TaxID=1937790 RepID=UPI001BD35CA3|nr:helix-turn-helix domain-containing protein [Ancylobacter sonchi]MBS7535728.1 helix-turn-helix domain-containing protein [Ancylobacter sonchi]
MRATSHCSRATSYRAFSGHETSIAETIWAERLEHAHQLLAAPEHTGRYISDVAMQSGFVDMPTFNRILGKRFGRTPGEAHFGSG